MTNITVPCPKIMERNMTHAVINASKFIRENKLYEIPTDREFSTSELANILDRLDHAAKVGIELPTGEIVYGAEARHHLNYGEYEKEYAVRDGRDGV